MPEYANLTILIIGCAAGAALLGLGALVITVVNRFTRIDPGPYGYGPEPQSRHTAEDEQ